MMAICVQSIANRVRGTAKAHIHDADPVRVERITRRLGHLLKQVERAAQQGQNRRTQEKVHNLLESRAAKMCAAILGMRGLKKNCSWKECESIADAMRFRTDCGEVIKVRVVTKPNGEFRPISGFGHIRRGQQSLCALALSAITTVHGSDYAAKGKGVVAAITALRQNVSASGYAFVVTGDIKNCFGSMKHQGVIAALPLPGSVVKNVILTSEEAPLQCKELPTSIDIDTIRNMAREGIPQGSLVSPLVASLLLGPMLDGLSSSNGIAVRFHDDMLILACDEFEAAAIQHALQQRFEQHSSGPFSAKYLQISAPGQSFSFLGYAMRILPSQIAPKLHACPIAAALDKVEITVMRYLASSSNDEEAIHRIKKYMAGWMNGHSEWDREECSINLVWTALMTTVQHHRPSCFDELNDFTEEIGLGLVCN